MTDENNGRLVSWKEIAAYLGCDVRTCMRWEKERGLPVHRPGGKPGPLVMAWKKELDVWLAGSSNRVDASSPADPAKAQAGWIAIHKKRILIPGLLIVLGILGFLGIRMLTSDREPSDFRIEGSRLIILNAAQKALWEFDAKLGSLWPEAEYRKKYQTRQFDEISGFSFSPALVIKDIDNDGHAEVLFVPHPAVGLKSKRLWCFDHRGVERWHFDGGREMVFGTKPYSWDYSASFETHDFNGDGRQEIVLIAENLTDFPTQLVMLSPAGDVLGEYWHSGRIMDFTLADLDSDGRRELLIGGVNNEYKKAFIAVFDPREVSGASPNSGFHKSPSLAAGSERAYVLIPLTDIEPYKDEHAILRNVEILDNGRIRGTISRIFVQYELDPRTLACLDVTLSNTFKVLHREAVQAGLIRSVLDDAYLEKLKKRLLYWTGRDWVSKPSLVIHRP